MSKVSAWVAAMEAAKDRWNVAEAEWSELKRTPPSTFCVRPTGWSDNVEIRVTEDGGLQFLVGAAKSITRFNVEPKDVSVLVGWVVNNFLDSNSPAFAEYMKALENHHE